ncbi:MAG: DUF6754 domain-containing protein [Candidatus Bathyarchaeia archaeon]
MSITIAPLMASTLAIWLMVAIFAVILQMLSTRGIFTLPIRRIEALDRIDDMIGRATEMGGTVMMGTGSARLTSSDALETMMAFAAVRYVAEQTARLGTRLLVTTGSPDHNPIVEDTVAQAARVAGNPDYYKVGEQVRLIGGDFYSYITATLQLLDPQSPENVKALIGFGGSGGYSASGPTVGMAANLAGVMTLGGTANIHQIHNFVACFDYAVIGDEVYAMSAYLTKDRKEVGTIMGLDFAKMVLIFLLFVGAAYYAATKGKLFT